MNNKFRVDMQTFKMIDPIISAVNISKSIATPSGSATNKQLNILHQISLEIKVGESVAIVGPSGAGKTTLLGILAGLDLPSSGNVFLGGVDLTKIDEEARTKLRNGNVGFVFQNFYLLENLTALENVTLPLELTYTKDAQQRASDLLQTVGLSDRLQHYPWQLSGGEQQRVALARAFVVKPVILFADEPTGNLDQKTGEIIIKQLFALNKSYNTTLVMITHENSLAQRCDRILRLEQGGLY